MKRAAITGIIIGISMSVGLLYSTTVSAKEYRYLGWETGGCKKCHKKQYESWIETPMANAYYSLEPGEKVEEKKKAGLDPNKDYTEDPECLKCHTTGYGKPSGFMNMEETEELHGITCEECHGPGSGYQAEKIKGTDESAEKHKLADAVAAGLLYPVKEEHCTNCHNDDHKHNSKVDEKYKFDFKERLDREKKKGAKDEGNHKHYLMEFDHGPIVGSYFQDDLKKKEALKKKAKTGTKKK
jgi:hypothetical protein